MGLEEKWGIGNTPGMMSKVIEKRKRRECENGIEVI